MGWLSPALFVALMSVGFCLQAQQAPSSTARPAVCNPDFISPSSPLEVISDLGGIDFTKYFADVLARVREKWYSVIPDQARPPVMKKGCSVIEFSIMRDGTVEDVKFISASDSKQLNHATWQGITKSVPFSALPVGYAQPNVVVRFHFYYNPDLGLTKTTVSGTPRASTSITATVIGLKEETSPPRALYTPFPLYPERSIQANKQGTVLLSLVVNKKGRVSHLRVVEGIDHDLDREARKTVKTWKFQPETVDGKATEVPLNIKLTFNLK